MKYKLSLQKTKQLFMLGVVTVLLMEQSVGFAFAQEPSTSDAVLLVSPTPNYSIATSSALVTDTPTPPPSDNPFADTTSPTITSSQNMLDQSLGSMQSQFSAVIKQPPVVGKLTKSTFRRDEKVSIVVGNQQAGDMKVKLYDDYGRQIPLSSIEETTVGSQTLVAIDPTQFAFHPGKYTLQITDSTGNTTTQNFTWGVLAINTNKSYYFPQDSADISMAVLDDKGIQVCNAQVSLDILGPNGATTHLSTDENSIIVNAQCGSHNMSLTPDYEAHITPTEIGDYAMTLTATTPNGTSTINETMHVVDSVAFDVERQSATRLYPANIYPMIFHLTANQDFTGIITERVPANFVISPYTSGSAQTYTDTNLVIPMPNTQVQFGMPSLSLAMPFTGTYKLVQGFGVALTDADEKAYYQEFGLAGHDGLDFAMPSGKKILATDDGVVVLAGSSAYGTTIVIQHAWGKSYYGHLSKLQVVSGQHVTKGEIIGFSGATGHVTGPHLHFGIKPLHPDFGNGFYGKVDPTPYLLGTSNTNVLGISTAPVGTSQRLISWNIALKKGQRVSLAYNYQTPGQSPAFFDVGPLQFVDQAGNSIFQESRQWQLAIDANSTAGPSNCTASANDTADTGAGTVSWGTVGSAVGACANAGTTAAASITSTTTSHFLKITGFGFAIPSTAKVVGVQFSIKQTGTAAQGGNVIDSHVYLIKAGTTQTSGTDQASATSWPTTSTARTYGSASTISWGGAWTATDINNTGFGVAIGAKSSNTKSQTATITGIVTATITYNQVPAAPTQSSPSNSATGVSVTPAFSMSTTDPETDNLQYKVTIYNQSGCSAGVVQTNDESSSQAGWSGQNATCSVANDCYTSGTAATYTTQASLSSNTQYWWRASAKDPLGSNTFTDSSTCNTFTTGIGGPTLDQLLRHGEWFNSGVIQPFTF